MNVQLHHERLSRRTLLRAAGAGALLIHPFGQALAKTTQRLDQLVEFDALGLADLVKTKQISRSELVEIVIRRIDAMNPALNFMTGKVFDRARQRAASSAFAADSRFAGVPILMKDLISVKGLPLTQGSKLFADYYPHKGAAYVDAIEASGLNIIGQTNVPEMASFIMDL
jgi:amidase